jgi:hypothetical protein
VADFSLLGGIRDVRDDGRQRARPANAPFRTLFPQKEPTMSLFPFFRRARKSTALRRKVQHPRRPARVCLGVEAMEERAVPAIVKSGTICVRSRGAA